MEIKTVKIENPDELNMILGHTHFIKTVEDIYEAMVNAVPMAKFGLAFCEASQDCLVRYTGTDEGLIELARDNAYRLSAGHTFILFMKDMFICLIVLVLSLTCWGIESSDQGEVRHNQEEPKNEQIKENTTGN